MVYYVFLCLTVEGLAGKKWVKYVSAFSFLYKEKIKAHSVEGQDSDWCSLLNIDTIYVILI